MSAENRERAVTALTVMIHQRWSGDRGRSADADDGSGQHGGATAGGPVNRSGRASADGR